jgi:hypothetical protein
MYSEANERRRPVYQQLIKQLTSGETYRPINSPVGSIDNEFPERIKSVLNILTKTPFPRIIFDCTSCPSLIFSKVLAILLTYQCDLTLLYSEAEDYFPTREEWESIKDPHYGMRVEGPFAGVRYVAKPPILQAGDIGEHPVLLILFPTFNTERTDGVLAEIDPAERIWNFGEPHDLSKNSFRIEMAQYYAAPIMYPTDKWSVVNTFDYRKTMRVLASIYAEYRSNYRIVVMPHGSKMQTLGVNLFAAIHQISMVFAMPLKYDPDKYSKKCVQVWAIPFGQTKDLIEKLNKSRVIGKY